MSWQGNTNPQSSATLRPPEPYQTNAHPPHSLHRHLPGRYRRRRPRRHLLRHRRQRLGHLPGLQRLADGNAGRGRGVQGPREQGGGEEGAERRVAYCGGAVRGVEGG